MCKAECYVKGLNTRLARIFLPIAVTMLLFSTLCTFHVTSAQAQVVGSPPPGVSCVVSAGNRNSTLATNGEYAMFGIPGDLGAIRARANCSDGSIGQSAVGFTDPAQNTVIQLGPIVFGTIDPIPAVINFAIERDGY